MLFEIMKYINNFFPTNLQEEGTFTIEGGTISLPSFVQEGDYFLIEGSNFNDNKVFENPATGMHDEEFDGAITVLAPPEKFLTLVAQIEDYEASTTRGGFASESFGGYSYTRLTTNGRVAGWQDVFRDRLNTWRKI